MSIITKTGDDGTTSLLFNRRVSKVDPRVEAAGDCDELNAALGLVRAFCSDPVIRDPLLIIQGELITLMGEIALLPEDRERHAKSGFPVVTGTMVEQLTAWATDLEGNRGTGHNDWATPGDNPTSAFLDAARTICRRAERAVVRLRADSLFENEHSIRYLNRLSDLCWLFARYAEKRGREAC
ncbi:MAG: cob(I)yrinic acid a,c-diamide adenosyltransferase [Chthoniobacteraceae bacterium]